MPAPLPAPPQTAAARAVAVKREAEEPLDLESRIAGRWFIRIGIVTILIAVSFFLKLTFDNNWIGPSGRVAIGVMLGALMLPWSHWLLGRGYSYFSEGITALGEATLFLSVWAGCQYYPLYTREIGFAAMIAITLVMGAVAIGRNSQRIAVLSLLGGLLTPILASSGRDQQVVLFSYLLVLGGGALAIQARKGWQSLLPIAFAGTQIYFWGWYSDFFHRASPQERTVLFATLFYFLFAALPAAESIRGKQLGGLDISVLMLDEFAYAGALFVLLWPEDRWPLTLLFLALAAGHVAVARLSATEIEPRPAVGRLLFAGLALTFVTIAIPVRLEGKWITLSFAVEGAILVWTGFRAASTFVRQFGYAMLGISALRVLFFPPEGGAFFWNERFGAYAFVVACFGIALWAGGSHWSEIESNEQAETGILAVAINIFALIALSREFWDYFAASGLDMDRGLAQHLALSLLWTVYATALLMVGLRRNSPLLRWQALILFGLVVCKVFLYDLSFLDRAYRILSFFVLGAVLVGVSFFYSRRLAQQKRKL
jgi:uncharacterized membrane protein